MVYPAVGAELSFPCCTVSCRYQGRCLSSRAFLAREANRASSTAPSTDGKKQITAHAAKQRTPAGVSGQPPMLIYGLYTAVVTPCDAPSRKTAMDAPRTPQAIPSLASKRKIENAVRPCSP